MFKYRYLSLKQKFEVNAAHWIQFVKSSNFIENLPSKHATPKITAALQAFQLLFPSSQKDATAALFTAPLLNYFYTILVSHSGKTLNESFKHLYSSSFHWSSKQCCCCIFL